MGQRTTQLRQMKGAPPRDARVIDAKFTEVRGERRSWWGKLKLAFITLFWAVVIGFLIPPAWIVVQRVSEMLAAG